MTWVKITQDEVQKFSELFKAINTSNTGYLTPEELKVGLEQMNEDFSFNSQEWQNVFNDMDVDNDGRVNYKEFILACSTYTTKINEKQIKELFDQIDVNGDGYIDMGEMKNFFQDEQYGESG